MFDLNTSKKLKQYGGSLPDTNYYNHIHKIIRINYNDKYFDFKYLGSIEVPNPNIHLAIIVTSEEILDTNGINKERLNFPPGIDKNENLVELPNGFVYTVPKNITSSTTNATSGGAGFSVQNSSMIDLKEVLIALSPPIDRDYTNKEVSIIQQDQIDPSREDVNDYSIGLFINKQGTILIKSKGSSITMGEDGMYLSGPINWEHSEHNREWMMDNPLQRFIPSTIPTGAVAIPELPNIAKFATIAEGARKVRNIISKFSDITNLFN